MSSVWFAREIAEFLQNNQIGIFATADSSLRTIWVGEIPDNITNALWLVETISPPPHTYVDTEYPVIDFWSMHSKSDLAHQKLEQVFNLLHRNYNYRTANWLIEYSKALGNIVDVDREREGGKLLRLSVQFYCRNLNNIS